MEKRGTIHRDIDLKEAARPPAERVKTNGTRQPVPLVLIPEDNAAIAAEDRVSGDLLQFLNCPCMAHLHVLSLVQRVIKSTLFTVAKGLGGEAFSFLWEGGLTGRKSVRRAA